MGLRAAVGLGCGRLVLSSEVSTRGGGADRGRRVGAAPWGQGLRLAWVAVGSFFRQRLQRVVALRTGDSFGRLAVAASGDTVGWRGCGTACASVDDLLRAHGRGWLQRGGGGACPALSGCGGAERTLQQQQGGRSKERGEKMIPLWILALVAAACAFFCGPMVMMHGPGAAGLLISRAAFEAFPKLYYYLLRTYGPAAAVFVFRHLPQCLISILAFIFGM
ncbi:unnamed protein product [Triticum turgidum subsp. durum]|uniref:Uncharacterized protein n=3 Tax=Triticum TaxID=4564 RepID=A0A9R1S8C9_TRITD|nr:unnamed protein product [Triticum turgidum subsp. durum]